MWQSKELLDHLQSSSTIQGRSFVTAEINLNQPLNILKVGNYRYRPFERVSRPISEQSRYASIQNSFDIFDEGNFYTGATDADVVIDGGFTDSSENVPVLFKTKKEKEQMLYSLEDCLSRFRPRSGINKVRYLETDGQYLNTPNEFTYLRPRFYMAHKDDPFKYWTSYRTESSVERGIATNFSSGRYYIDDAAPFVVYKDRVPANRLIVKMQTGIGDINLGPFRKASEEFPDPFFGQENASIPVRWSIQYLQDNNWITAISFNENSLRPNDMPIIGADGYVEVYYGLKIPARYSNFFKHAGEYNFKESLPPSSIEGYAYLVGATESSPGQYYVWNGQTYDVPFVPEYGWQLKNEGEQNDYGFVSELTNPPSFRSSLSSREQFREFQYISGARVVVETMSKSDAVFDLIELSPRLSIDLTDRTESFSIRKPASDLGVSGLPVGQLLAGTGDISLFDYDLALSPQNSNSIISGLWSQNIQIKFFEVVERVQGYDYYIPIKTMYADGFPDVNSKDRMVRLSLRDLYFYFENTTAPQVFLSNVSLSIAVSILLDYIGFSNYIFLRVEGEADPVIPAFFIKPDQSVAQVLQQLALSTQYTMFFDEYNNFVVMSRDYILPSTTQRETNLTLIGSKDYSQNSAIQNESTSEVLSNIIEVNSQTNSVFNGGSINYTSRYIQRETRVNETDSVLDKDQSWVYNLAQLWDVSGEKYGRTQRNASQSQESLVLAAMPLNADLVDRHPSVANNQILNNTIDLGEAIHWINKYNGYLYANGEVIRYDAVQYSIPGLSPATGDLVWITSLVEYEKYFSILPFNGKMYATGLLRIYTEPYYETINGVTRLKNGPVAKSGRCQFGTGVVSASGETLPVYHSAGLSSYWTDNANVRGVRMQSKYLLSSENFRSSESQVASFEISVFQVPTGVGNETRSDAKAIIKTVNNHTFAIGDIVYIENVDPRINGSHTINNVVSTTVSNVTTSKEFSFPVSISLGSVSQTGIDNIFAKAYVVKYDNYSSMAPAGVANEIGIRSSRNGIVKNFLSSSIISENDVQRLYSVESGTVQSSSLVFSGGAYLNTESPIDYLSYVYKPLNNSFTHFGTRLRVIGRQDDDDIRLQTPVGVMKFYGVQEVTPEQLATIGGSSAGISIMTDPAKNTGYYFEIAALTADSISSYTNSASIHDVIFYKIVGVSGQAIPIKLWGGYAGIITDTGEEIGQGRVVAEPLSSTYDLSIEYQDIGQTRRFYLFLNGTLIQTVDDVDPLPRVNNMALFVRGSSRAMFENVYALTENYAQNTASTLNLPSNKIFRSDDITADSAFRKYAVSGIVQSSYLSGISPSEPPAYSMYYDEFGTIMREAAYFNVRYDKAYPALTATLVPSFSKIKGYVTSGFMAGAYGAEFLIFNATDSAIAIDGSENSLSIIGVTFTQESNNEYSVDNYFDKVGDLSNPSVFGGQVIVSPNRSQEEYFQIKSSRMQHGKKDFNLTLPYLQSTDAAENLMGWLVNKIMKPRLSLGIRIFPNPMIQLGDIVNIDFDTNDDDPISVLAERDSRFVVYNIEYSRDRSGPSMTLYLSEVR